MKQLHAILTLLLIAGINTLTAEDGDSQKDHAQNESEHTESKAGPNGGRVIYELEPHLEFFVRADRTIQIAALGEKGEVIPMKKMSVQLIGGNRTNPIQMKFEKEGPLLVSDQALPELAITPVVLTFNTAESERVRVKFNVNLSKCGSCDYQEYACICGH